MQTAIVLAIVAALSWGLSDIAAKIGLSNAQKYTVLFWGQLFGASVLLVAWMLTGSFAWSPMWLFILLLAVINFIGTYAYYHAIHEKGVAIASPIINAWPVITVPLAVFIYREALSSMQLLAILLILAGVFGLSFTSSFRLDKSLLYALLSMAMWGLFFLIVKVPSAALGSLAVVAGVKLFTGICAFPAAKLRIPTLRIGMVIFAVGVLDAIGFLLYGYSIEKLPIAIAAPISASVPLFTIFLGVVFLHERITMRQGIAALATIVGVAIISL